MLAEAAGLRPDIIVRHPGGLPVAVETEYTPANTVEKDACERLGKTLQKDGQDIEQSIALRIPKTLSTAKQNELESLIEEARLEFCLFSGDPENPSRWPETGWIEGGIDDLADCIEYASLSENSIARGMSILEDSVAQTAEILAEDCADTPALLEKIADTLHQQGGVQTWRMAMAIIANALTFHISIVGTRSSKGSFVVKSLDEFRNQRGHILKGKILQHWRDILKKINYWPIFEIASDLLLPLSNGTGRKILKGLSEAAIDLDALGATSQHDLSGRMLQRLITDRKFLATFYTLPSSATLLAELAVARLDTEWSDKEAICSLRVADFACGTGALLNAAYDAMMSRYRRRGLDDGEIHPRMIEKVLVGTDIMPAATHITASILSSAHPRIPFGNTSIITLPYGEQSRKSGRRVALGALDLIEYEKTLPLFGTGQQMVRGDAESSEEQVDMPHDSFDVVIMNPPFTRPTNHAGERSNTPVPSFGAFSTSKDEQRTMSRQLKKIHEPGMAGHGNAGLASNFIDIAHAKVKRSGGVLALVLPATFTQGGAWDRARQLLLDQYKDIVIASIAATGSTAYAFSADTDMAEVLVVATRNEGGGDNDSPVLFLNFLRRPQSILEAITVARAVQALPSSQAAGSISLGRGQNMGSFLRTAWSEGTAPVGIRATSVAQAGIGLMQGELYLPRKSDTISLPLVQLRELGERGLLHRDISGNTITESGPPRGPFNIVGIGPGEVPIYPALWNHDATRETFMVTEPDTQGYVREGCDDHANDVWERTASHLHFNLDFTLSSQPLAACITADQTIGGRAWPNFLCADSQWDKPLALWANTTVGLLSFWWLGSRQQSGRAILTISKLPKLMTLDPRQLSTEQLDHANTLFDELEDQAFLPANEAWRDDVRQALDRAMLIDLLGFSEDIMEPLDLLRRQWCAEPSVHGGKKTAPP